MRPNQGRLLAGLMAASAANRTTAEQAVIDPGKANQDAPKVDPKKVNYWNSGSPMRSEEIIRKSRQWVRAKQTKRGKRGKRCKG